MTRHDRKPPLLDALVRVDQIPADGRDIKVEATPEQLSELAQRLGVTSVERFGAKVHMRVFRGGVRAQGRLSARVVQPCVVTFEPVTQMIDEPVDRVFLPGSEEAYTGAAGAEVYVNLEGDDPPDRYEGDEIDLCELLVEVLSLAVDPYPRAEGAEIPEKARDEDEARMSPFAKLKVLKGDAE